MNIPNRITLARIVMIVIYMFFAFPLPGVPEGSFFDKYRLIVALLIFIAASITDLIDGKLARKLNQVTDFGKFLDPIADKLLVSVALLSFCCINTMYIWATMVILTREFAITGLRLVAAKNGTVIAAGRSGKIKTALSCAALITILTAWAVQKAFAGIGFMMIIAEIIFWAGNIVLLAAVVMTIYSGIEYFVKNKDALKDR